MMYSSNVPVMSIHELAKLDYEQRQAEYKLEQDKIAAEKAANIKAFKESADRINKYIVEAQNESYDRAKFLENLKVALTSSALFKVCKESFTDEKLSKLDETVLSKLFTEFVREQGAGKLMLDWKHKNCILAEMARVCKETYEGVRNRLSPVRGYYEDANKPDVNEKDPSVESPDVLKLDKIEVDDFYNKVADIDTQQASDMIHDRVSDAIATFIDQNAKNKAECEEIIDDAKAKMDAAKSPEDVSAIQAEAARHVQFHKHYRNKNPFHYMVESIIKASFRDDNLKTRNINETKVDMDNIVHSAKLVYSFIETLNTLEAVDEQFIKDYIKSAITD